MIVRRHAPGSFLVAMLALLATASWVAPAGAQLVPRRDDEPTQFSQPPRPKPEEPPEPRPEDLPIASDQPVVRPSPAEPHELPLAADARDTSAAVITFELGGQGAHVDVNGAKTGAGGALGGHMFILGHTGTMTYRLVVNGALGGQTTGFLTRFSGDASIGPAAALGSSARVFVRTGMEASGHKDDELDTSLFTLPSAFAGIQLSADKVVFEIGPRVGATLRAVYAPGNETEGRRHTRRSRVAPSWGGTMALASSVLLLQASVTRVEERAGLWLAEGSACPVFGGDQVFVLCGTAQHWRGDVVGPLGTLPDVGSWVLGASIGFGFSKIRRR